MTLKGSKGGGGGGGVWVEDSLVKMLRMPNLRGVNHRLWSPIFEKKSHYL